MKLLYRSFMLLSAVFFGSFSAHAQNLKIDIKLENVSDSSAYLAHYLDGRIFADDTTQLVNGVGLFQKDSLLDQGIYVVYLPSQKYFDLLIGNDQEFSIKSNSEDFVNMLTIKGSEESEAFADFQKFMKEKTENSRKLQAEYKDKLKDEKAKAEYRALFEKADKEVKAYIKTLNEKFPKPSFVSEFANFTLSPEAPDFSDSIASDVPDREKEIKLRNYLWTKNHYLSNLNPADDRYLRTPLLKDKLKFFFENILIQQRDSIVKESVKLIEQARPNKKCFQYYTQYALNYAIKSKIMGVDAAFVDLARRYYLSGQATWADSTLMANIKERVIKLQYNLLDMKAQDLALETIDGEFVRLHEIDANYTILYFFETDCGHCKKVTPHLIPEILEPYKDLGIKIMAIYTQQDKEAWQKYIEDNVLYDFVNCYDPNYQSNFRIFYDVYSTPTIYLLDKNKKIIAKRLDLENLKGFLDHERKVKAEKS
ncbi:AhpC/TSA family protein [Ancylomarina salipaludis]|uniref:AhpC/TSA family protein n=1 Tax=Ancylomarina salipaludis TaxID=2501299 RepID=A0A4Q1JLZ9_9BACT|nr:TlpA disulfide reductase family protein [Ancylomarina salipaludis]RXQ95557.1 AhpC/TSA family protein [Ancylomarina salipaludis]